MLHWILGLVAVGLWTTAYTWYFVPDIRRWLWRRQNRRAFAELRRAHARAAWTQRGAARQRAAAPPARPREALHALSISTLPLIPARPANDP